MKIIDTNKAAKILNVHPSRVRVLIREGRLPAQKVGRDWIIDEMDLDKVRKRKPGRPKKTTLKPLPSNKELIKNLKKSLSARSDGYNTILNEIFGRSLKKEITAKELDNVTRAIDNETMKIKQEIKKAKQALKAKTKK